MEPLKKKILIVEDQESVRESLRDWLIEDGYEVESTETGEEALEKIKNEDFGFIVLDLRLPGIDGLQVFEQAKALRPETKGAIITAYPSKETWERAKGLGISDFLPKPFAVTDLEKIIGSALEEIEGKKVPDKHLWLSLGAGPYKICDRNYECESCPLQEAILSDDRVFIFLSDAEVAKLKQSPDAEKFCRYGTARFFKKDRPYLDTPA
ncbi:response regulator [Chloroflexota bacterium]